jgi:hypothetical protein
MWTSRVSTGRYRGGAGPSPPEPMGGHRGALAGAIMIKKTKPLCVLALLLAAACSSVSALELSEEYRSVGYLELAYHELHTEYEAEKARGAVLPEVEQAYLDLLPEYELFMARREIYGNREFEGIALLKKVLEKRPGDEAAAALMNRALHKLARRATALGQDRLAAGECEEAVVAFNQAFEWVPEFEPAIEGVAEVDALVAKMHGEAQQQFLEAIRKLPQLRYPEVDWHARIALERDPKREDSAELRDRAQRELASRAMDRAVQARDEGVYGAALMEFRTARNYWPATVGVDEHVAHMEREVKAQQVIERAMLMLNADRLDRANEGLDEAAAMTSLQAGWINEIRLMVRTRAGHIAYGRARDLELQGLKQEALEAFQAVVEEWPNGLLDEQVRVSALQLDIRGAELAYAEGDKSQQAGDLAVALEQFLTAQTFYENYKDVGERVRALRELLAEQNGG